MGPLSTLTSNVFPCSILKAKHFIWRNVTVDLAHKIYGVEGPNKHYMFILHGLLGSKKNWDSMSKALAPAVEAKVVAVDLRNHGESPHSEDHSYVSLALDVVKLIKGLSATNNTLIGHSMGGRTSMVLALTQPDLVKRLVIVDVSPVSTPGLEFFPMVIDLMKTVEFKPTDDIANCRALARTVFSKSKIVDPNELGFIFLNIGKRHDGTNGWIVNLDVLKEHMNQIGSFPSEMSGKTYEGPTLFIAGKQSSFIPNSDLAGIRSYFPKADLVYVDAGHNVHAENPQKFKELVIDFVKKHK